MAKTDILELKILWTVDEETEDEPIPYLGVDFIINGVSLFDMIREIEIPYFEEEGQPYLAGNYALESAEIMHMIITAVLTEKYYADEVAERIEKIVDQAKKLMQEISVVDYKTAA